MPYKLFSNKKKIYVENIEKLTKKKLVQFREISMETEQLTQKNVWAISSFKMLCADYSKRAVKE